MRDAQLARRVLDYNYRIFNEYAQPVASLVLLADEDPHWHPAAFHNDVLGTVMGISFVIAKLIDYATRTDWMMALPEPHQQRYWQAVLDLATRDGSRGAKRER